MQFETLHKVLSRVVMARVNKKIRVYFDAINAV